MLQAPEAQASLTGRKPLDLWCQGALAPGSAPVDPTVSPQALAAASELCELPGEPDLGADSAPSPGCRALHVRGAHSTTLLEQSAEAGHA